MTLAPQPRRIVVTESEGPGAALAAQLREAGVDVWMLPVVTHGPAPDPGPLDAALARLSEFAWVAFTSARAVDAVCQRPAWHAWPWGTAVRPRVAAVGSMTAAVLGRHGIRVDLCPGEPGARALAAAMIAAEAGTMAGRTVLWPRSQIARPDLAEVLKWAGADVVAPEAYCTLATTPADLAGVCSDLGAGRVDAVTFLSPSAAANLAALLPGGSLSVLAGQTLVASVGPTTSAVLAELGAPPGLEAASRTAGDLAAALLSYFGLSGRTQP